MSTAEISVNVFVVYQYVWSDLNVVLSIFVFIFNLQWFFL
jgi:hypothetical protein